MRTDDTSPEPVEANVENGDLVVRLADGTVLSSPVSHFPRLAGASPASLARVELSPFGVHWPDLDEDLSVDGLRRLAVQTT
jgi:hypothetical protein